MSAFRNRKGIFSGSSDSVPIRDVRKVDVPTSDNKVVVTSLVLDSVDTSDYHCRHPINMEEVSLQEMIENGVPIKEIPCSTLLDSNDPLDSPQMEDAGDKVLQTLEDDSIS